MLILRSWDPEAYLFLRAHLKIRLLVEPHPLHPLLDSHEQVVPKISVLLSNHPLVGEPLAVQHHSLLLPSLQLRQQAVNRTQN